jgi:hypothetical protein
MERKKTDTNDPVIQWRKTGGGTFRMGKGKIIKPGQTFNAPLSAIPKGFRDTVVPVDAAAAAAIAGGKEVKSDTKAPELEYFVQHVSGGWYNNEFMESLKK